jgi:hypothetical protein
MSTHFSGGFDDREAAAVFDTHLGHVGTTNAIEMDQAQTDRVFNLGYFTWVEQLGVEIDEFERRREQSFWNGLRPLTDRWDEMIVEFNDATGASHG